MQGVDVSSRAFPPNIVGDGNVETVIDVSAPTHRFYRIILQ